MQPTPAKQDEPLVCRYCKQPMAPGEIEKHLECGRKPGWGSITPTSPVRDLDGEERLRTLKNIEKDIHTIRNASVLWMAFVIAGATLAVVIWIQRL